MPADASRIGTVIASPAASSAVILANAGPDVDVQFYPVPTRRIWSADAKPVRRTRLGAGTAILAGMTSHLRPVMMPR
jgi:hypothetical protein